MEPDENFNKMDKLSQENVQDFLDFEAELSGEDEEEEIEDDEVDSVADNVLDLVDDYELPAEEELRDEISDLHMKQIRDDDAELLKELQEQFLDDGELHNDGTGRTKKFAWKNSDTTDAICKDRNSSSDSDSDNAPDENWSSLCKEKRKWQQENEKEDLSGVIYPGHKRPHLKMKIIGKPDYIKGTEESSKDLSRKRPRGSFLNLDNESASQMLKKLKASEGNCDGSRTTKLYLFRNNLAKKMLADKGNVSDKYSGDSNSVFKKI